MDIDENPPWTGGQLKRLGTAIVDPSSARGDYPAYPEVMSWHADLADEVSTQIADREWDSLGGAFDVSSRAKTIDTLREKLIRERHLKLNQVQDLSGVRVDFDGHLEEQTLFAEELATYFGGSPRAVLKDIRQDPHSGYRAVHVWLKVPAGRVEVQLRTRSQSAWANAYERLGDLLGRQIRYGDLGDGPARNAVATMQRLSTVLKEAEEGHLDAIVQQRQVADLQRRVEALEPQTGSVDEDELDGLREEVEAAARPLEQTEAVYRRSLAKYLEGLDDLQRRLDQVEASESR